MRMITIEVLVLLDQGQHLQRVTLHAGATVRDALAACDASSGLSAEGLLLARHGRRIRPEEPVAEGDRIDVLKPLHADPKEQRRARVRAGRASARRPAVPRSG